MRAKSPAIDWAVEERRRVFEELGALPDAARSDVQSLAARTYLRDRLSKLDQLIAALEQAEA